MWRCIVCALAIAATLLTAPAHSASVHVGATTSLKDSGIFAHLAAAFHDATGIDVKLISKGSSEIATLAARGHFDLLILNHPEVSDAIVARGDGLAAHPIMGDAYVIVGPIEDPANVRQAADIASALVAVARERASFVSRGDNSGTHSVELGLWASVGVDPKKRSGSWYRETGLGMAEALQTAARLKAYVLVDRATWLASGVASTLPLLQERNPPLNRYVAVPVNPARHLSVQTAEADRFLNWLTSPDGQNAISAYKVGGERPFAPVTRQGI
jgi:tungstate transport system substrate-binding protein